jgi:hypothetical protein
MTWVRIDDQMPQHPKLARVGPLGFALQIAALCYANRHLTDGFIPWSVARSLLNWEFVEPPDEDGNERIMRLSISNGHIGDDVSADYVIGLLVSAGVWKEAAGGYRIHDYRKYQPTKKEVLAQQAHKVAAGQAGGIAAAKARAQAKRKQKA